jgi:CPA1 family monovalent cation:H+ antiporter
VWGGIRGSISMVLVLSLPQDFPHRELILSMTFGVVSITLVGQGMTMRPILRWLGLVVTPKWRRSYEKYRGGLVAMGRVMAELEEMAAEKTISQGVFKKLKKEYRKRVEDLEKGILNLDTDIELLENEETISAKRHLLMVEKDTIKASYSGGIISREVADELTKKIDVELDMLEREED